MGIKRQVLRNEQLEELEKNYFLVSNLKTISGLLRNRRETDDSNQVNPHAKVELGTGHVARQDCNGNRLIIVLREENL